MTLENILSSGTNTVDSVIKKICCPKNHQLKPKQRVMTTDGTLRNPNCDICGIDDLESNHTFYFRCDNISCSFDLCASCYYLKMTGNEEVLKKLAQAR